jgi:hypothetical protein
VLACTKNNLAAFPTSLAFRIVSGTNDSGRLDWLGGQLVGPKNQKWQYRPVMYPWCAGYFTYGVAWRV